MATRTLFLTATACLLGCNAVLGLGEGELTNGDGGTAGTGTTTSNPPSTATGDGDTSATADASVSTADVTATTNGSTATGDPCILEVGLDNGDFTRWSFDSPVRWNEFGNGPDIVTTEMVPGGGGMILTVSESTSFDHYGFMFQDSLAVPGFTQCVMLHGESRKTNGTGRLSAEVTFEGGKLAMDLPASGQLTPFAKSCKLLGEITEHHVRILVDQMGGTPASPGGATVEVPFIAFDHVCCDGVVETCPVE